MLILKLGVQVTMLFALFVGYLEVITFFVLGNDYPFEVYEHGSAYYSDSFVVIGGYTSDATAISSIYL